MYVAYPDKLLNFTEKHGEEIAREWCKSLKSNPRTISYRRIPEADLVAQGAAFYRDAKRLYFERETYGAVCEYFSRFAEDQFNAEVPVEEALYALIMLRRQMWLFAEFQVLFTTALDQVQAMESINRMVLLTDYATHTVAKRYRELCQR